MPPPIFSNFNQKINFRNEKQTNNPPIYRIAQCVFFSVHSTVQTRSIGNLLVEGIGDIPTSVSERLEQYQNIEVQILPIGMLRARDFILLPTLPMLLKYTTSARWAYREQVTFF
ncbi:MAG: hypothetical protein MUE81_22510 [Thermoflexibacter sp.]|nr:hypothetical protein [Thermoflexibacter sp.]